MKSVLAAFAAAASWTVISSASAAVIASNSFESPSFPTVPAGGVLYSPYGAPFSNPNPGSSVSATGFTFNGYSGILSNSDKNSNFSTLDQPTYYGVLPATTFGTQVGFIQELNSDPSIDWTVANLTVGAKYQLSFWTAGGMAPNVAPDPFTVSLAGGTPSSNTSFDPTSGKYTFETVDFVANAGSVTVGFNGSDSSGNLLTGFDNMAISSVPEPAGWTMMLSGLFAAGALLRRSRTAKSGVATVG